MCITIKIDVDRLKQLLENTFEQLSRSLIALDALGKMVHGYQFKSNHIPCIRRQDRKNFRFKSWNCRKVRRINHNDRVN